MRRKPSRSAGFWSSIEPVAHTLPFELGPVREAIPTPGSPTTDRLQAAAWGDGGYYSAAEWGGDKSGDRVRGR